MHGTLLPGAPAPGAGMEAGPTGSTCRDHRDVLHVRAAWAACARLHVITREGQQAINRQRPTALPPSPYPTPCRTRAPQAMRRKPLTCAVSGASKSWRRRRTWAAMKRMSSATTRPSWTSARPTRPLLVSGGAYAQVYIGRAAGGLVLPLSQRGGRETETEAR